MPYLQIPNACVKTGSFQSFFFFEILLQNRKLPTFVLEHLQFKNLYVFNESLRNGLF